MTTNCYILRDKIHYHLNCLLLNTMFVGDDCNIGKNPDHLSDTLERDENENLLACQQSIYAQCHIY